MKDFSIDQIEALIAGNPNTRNFLRKELVTTYDEFVDVLYDEMDIVISTLEENPQHYYDDNEDKITHSIVSMLKMRNYSATQGTTNGGNVDITVKCNNPLWSWIGEAKIYKTLDNLQEGFLQLTTRYRNASPTFASRGMLAYTKRSDAATHLKEWDEHVAAQKLPEFTRTDCTKRPGMAFLTTHKDNASGQPVKIRHNVIALYHLPEDKSGRTAAKYKKRRGEAAD
ncbi:hypothetical protein [Duganella sp. BJB476]|uniref:hypothetical protein n=1 Tax=Duganella sp. BJB476 TaxID=1871176 RepID=UPI000E351C86|nr:hypothetical protein [Duganella sp. BJB476]RFP23898.1 hypothetical protein D0T21_28490 [Duganella sp. BJB476]